MIHFRDPDIGNALCGSSTIHLVDEIDDTTCADCLYEYQDLAGEDDDD